MADRTQSIIYRIAVDTKGLAEEIAKAKAAIASLQEHNQKLAAAQAQNTDGTKQLGEAQKGLARDIDNTGKAVERVDRQIGAAGDGRQAPATRQVDRNYHPVLDSILGQLRACCNGMQRLGDRDRSPEFSGGNQSQLQQQMAKEWRDVVLDDYRDKNNDRLKDLTQAERDRINSTGDLHEKLLREQFINEAKLQRERHERDAAAARSFLAGNEPTAGTRTGGVDRDSDLPKSAAPQPPAAPALQDRDYSGHFDRLIRQMKDCCDAIKTGGDRNRPDPNRESREKQERNQRAADQGADAARAGQQAEADRANRDLTRQIAQNKADKELAEAKRLREAAEREANASRFGPRVYEAAKDLGSDYTSAGTHEGKAGRAREMIARGDSVEDILAFARQTQKAYANNWGDTNLKQRQLRMNQMESIRWMTFIAELERATKVQGDNSDAVAAETVARAKATEAATRDADAHERIAEQVAERVEETPPVAPKPARRPHRARTDDAPAAASVEKLDQAADNAAKSVEQHGKASAEAAKSVATNKDRRDPLGEQTGRALTLLSDARKDEGKEFIRRIHRTDEDPQAIIRDLRAAAEAIDRTNTPGQGTNEVNLKDSERLREVAADIDQQAKANRRPGDLPTESQLRLAQQVIDAERRALQEADAADKAAGKKPADYSSRYDTFKQYKYDPGPYGRGSMFDRLNRAQDNIDVGELPEQAYIREAVARLEKAEERGFLATRRRVGDLKKGDQLGSGFVLKEDPQPTSFGESMLVGDRYVDKNETLPIRVREEERAAEVLKQIRVEQEKFSRDRLDHEKRLVRLTRAGDLKVGDVVVDKKTDRKIVNTPNFYDDKREAFANTENLKTGRGSRLKLSGDPDEQVRVLVDPKPREDYNQRYAAHKEDAAAAYQRTFDKLVDSDVAAAKADPLKPAGLDRREKSILSGVDNRFRGEVEKLHTLLQQPTSPKLRDEITQITQKLRQGLTTDDHLKAGDTLQGVERRVSNAKFVDDQRERNAAYDKSLFSDPNAKELRERASRLGIENRSKLSADELKKLIAEQTSPISDKDRALLIGSDSRKHKDVDKLAQDIYKGDFASARKYLDTAYQDHRKYQPHDEEGKKGLLALRSRFPEKDRELDRIASVINQPATKGSKADKLHFSGYQDQIRSGRELDSVLRRMRSEAERLKESAEPGGYNEKFPGHKAAAERNSKLLFQAADELEKEIKARRALVRGAEDNAAAVAENTKTVAQDTAKRDAAAPAPATPAAPVGPVAETEETYAARREREQAIRERAEALNVRGLNKKTPEQLQREVDDLVSPISDEDRRAFVGDTPRRHSDVDTIASHIYRGDYLGASAEVDRQQKLLPSRPDNEQADAGAALARIRKQLQDLHESPETAALNEKVGRNISPTADLSEIAKEFRRDAAKYQKQLDEGRRERTVAAYKVDDAGRRRPVYEYSNKPLSDSGREYAQKEVDTKSARADAIDQTIKSRQERFVAQRAAAIEAGAKAAEKEVAAAEVDAQAAEEHAQAAEIDRRSWKETKEQRRALRESRNRGARRRDVRRPEPAPPQAMPEPVDEDPFANDPLPPFDWKAATDAEKQERRRLISRRSSQKYRARRAAAAAGAVAAPEPDPIPEPVAEAPEPPARPARRRRAPSVPTPDASTPDADKPEGGQDSDMLGRFLRQMEECCEAIKNLGEKQAKGNSAGRSDEDREKDRAERAEKREEGAAERAAKRQEAAAERAEKRQEAADDRAAKREDEKAARAEKRGEEAAAAAERREEDKAARAEKREEEKAAREAHAEEEKAQRAEKREEDSAHRAEQREVDRQAKADEREAAKLERAEKREEDKAARAEKRQEEAEERLRKRAEDAQERAIKREEAFNERVEKREDERVARLAKQEEDAQERERKRAEEAQDRKERYEEDAAERARRRAERDADAEEKARAKSLKAIEDEEAARRANSEALRQQYPGAFRDRDSDPAPAPSRRNRDEPDYSVIDRRFPSNDAAREQRTFEPDRYQIPNRDFLLSDRRASAAVPTERQAQLAAAAARVVEERLSNARQRAAVAAGIATAAEDGLTARRLAARASRGHADHYDEARRLAREVPEYRLRDGRAVPVVPARGRGSLDLNRVSPLLGTSPNAARNVQQMLGFDQLRREFGASFPARRAQIARDELFRDIPGRFSSAQMAEFNRGIQQFVAAQQRRGNLEEVDAARGERLRQDFAQSFPARREAIRRATYDANQREIDQARIDPERIREMNVGLEQWLAAQKRETEARDRVTETMNRLKANLARERGIESDYRRDLRGSNRDDLDRSNAALNRLLGRQVDRVDFPNRVRGDNVARRTDLIDTGNTEELRRSLGNIDRTIRDVQESRVAFRPTSDEDIERVNKSIRDFGENVRRQVDAERDGNRLTRHEVDRLNDSLKDFNDRLALIRKDTAIGRGIDRDEVNRINRTGNEYLLNRRVTDAFNPPDREGDAQRRQILKDVETAIKDFHKGIRDAEARRRNVPADFYDRPIDRSTLGQRARDLGWARDPRPAPDRNRGFLPILDQDYVGRRRRLDDDDRPFGMAPVARRPLIDMDRPITRQAAYQALRGVDDNDPAIRNFRAAMERLALTARTLDNQQNRLIYTARTEEEMRRDAITAGRARSREIGPDGYVGRRRRDEDDYRPRNYVGRRRRPLLGDEDDEDLGGLQNRGLLGEAINRFSPRRRRRRRRALLDGDDDGSALGTLTRSASTASRAASSAAGAGDEVTKFFSQNTGRMNHWQIMFAAILAIVTVLIPAIAALVGVLGAFLSAATAALLPIGALALAVVANFSKLQDAMKDAAAGARDLETPLGRAASALNSFKTAFTAFGTATQAPVFDLIAQGAGGLAPLIQKMVPLVSAAARGISQSLEDVFARLNGDRFANFLDFLVQEGPKAIRSFVHGLAGITAGIGELAVSFQPYIDFFLKGFENMGDSFEEWAQSLSSDPKFKEFMDYVMSAGPRVVDTLNAFLDILINIGAALMPLGEVFMALIRYFGMMSNAIPLTALQIFAGILATLFIAVTVAGAIVALNRAMAIVGPVFAASGAAVRGYTASLIGATAATRAFTIATRVMQAATVVGLALTAVATVFNLFSDNSKKATNDTETFAAANEELAGALRASGYAIDDNIKKMALLALQKNGLLDKGLAAGFTADELVNAYLGSPEEWDRLMKTAEDRANELERTTVGKGDIFKSDPNDPAGEKGGRQRVRTDAEQKEIDNARAFVSTGKNIKGDLDKKIAADKAAENAARQAEAATTGRSLSELELRDALEKSMAAEDAATKRVNAAIEAKQAAARATESLHDAEVAHTRAVEDGVDAQNRAALKLARSELSLENAQHRVVEAQRKVNEAREAAALKVENYQRKLRDLPLDEEQNAISLARAQENLVKVLNDATASDLDRRQAYLDLERARNAQRDGIFDGEVTRREAGREIEKGVEGSDEVLQAIRDLKDAQLSEKEALQAAKDARIQYNRDLEDSAEKIKDTKTALDEAKIAAAEANEKFQQLALIAGQSADQLDRIVANRAELAKGLSITLSAPGFESVEAKLRTIVLYKKAEALMAKNPSLTIEQALMQAARSSPELNIGGYQGDPKAFKETGTFIGPKARTPFAGGGMELTSGERAWQRSNPERATGQIEGPGTQVSDSIPAWLSVGEHVWTAAETMAIGGHKMMENLRQAVITGRFTKEDVSRFMYGTKMQLASGGGVPRFAGGGPIQGRPKGPNASYLDVMVYLADGRMVSLRQANEQSLVYYRDRSDVPAFKQPVSIQPVDDWMGIPGRRPPTRPSPPGDNKMFASVMVYLADGRMVSLSYAARNGLQYWMNEEDIGRPGSVKDPNNGKSPFVRPYFPGLGVGINRPGGPIGMPGRNPSVIPDRNGLVNYNTNRGLQMGNITINNPVIEPSGQSLYRTVRRLALEYQD